jgi:hypothetical protein
MLNVRDKVSNALVNPAFNFLNVGQGIWKQTFERILEKRYAPYVEQYIQEKNLTEERIISQLGLIADVVDALLGRKFEIEGKETVYDAAFRYAHWKERFDWEAMTVFDMVASQSTISFWLFELGAVCGEEDYLLNNPGQLTAMLEQYPRRSQRVYDKLHKEEPKS